MKYTYNSHEMIIHPENAYRGKPISQFFDDYLISEKKRRNYIHTGLVTLNHQKIHDLDQILNNEDIIIQLPEDKIDWPCSQICANVVYEDPFIYIVHKEPGCIIHGDSDDITCLNAQAATYQSMHGIHAPVRPIHRLDKETTGLVIYSKIPFFQPWFDDQLSKKNISRHYYAICEGKMPKQKKFTCRLPIGKDRHVNGKYRISKTGKSAITHFTCVKQIGEYMLVRCALETGRTHQIRVHLSSLGYPIVNDTIYGSYTSTFHHMGLWAQEVIIFDPITHTSRTIQDINNPDFELFL